MGHVEFICPEVLLLILRITIGQRKFAMQKYCTILRFWFETEYAYLLANVSPSSREIVDYNHVYSLR